MFKLQTSNNNHGFRFSPHNKARWSKDLKVSQLPPPLVESPTTREAHSTAGLKGTGQPSSNQLSSSEPDKVNFIEVLINYLWPAALTHCGFQKLWPALLRSGFQKLWPVLRQTLLWQNLVGKCSWHCRSRHNLLNILKCILCIISKWWTDELWDGYSSGLPGQGIHHGLTLSPIDTSERIDASTSQYAGC